jgi:cell pole-organizing protein PopZ
MKNWIEVSPHTGLEEDAPANNAGSGNVSMPPDAVKKKKQTLIDRNGKIDARSKSYREHRAKLEAARVKRQERRNARASKFIESVKNKSLNTETTYAPGYDTAKPMADMSNRNNLNAAKSATGYELYHKDFSSAMQHAYKFAKSKGVTVDPNEIDNKVASGPRKPSSGKTNSYILGTNKKQNVHIQVANLDNKRYELNMYIS